MGRAKLARLFAPIAVKIRGCRLDERHAFAEDCLELFGAREFRTERDRHAIVTVAAFRPPRHRPTPVHAQTTKVKRCESGQKKSRQTAAQEVNREASNRVDRPLRSRGLDEANPSARLLRSS